MTCRRIHGSIWHCMVTPARSILVCLLFLVSFSSYPAASTAASDSTSDNPQSQRASALKARKDYALLFADNQYDSWASLTNPIPDAHALQTELEDNYGFETRVVENPRFSDVFATLGDLRKRTFGPEDQLLVFFAGHGFFDDSTREGFLVARDSDANDATRSHYIAYSRLRDLLNSLPVKHVFLIVDACFGGTIDRRIAEAGHRGIDQYALLTLPQLLERKSALTTRKFLTSGGKEYVPDGAPGHHSPFVDHLLESLRSYGGARGYLTINSILSDVEAVKPEPVWGDWGSDEPGSEFLFIPRQVKTRLADPNDAIFQPRGGRSLALDIADTVPRRSVAVVGFENATHRPDHDWLNGVLSEALVSELAAGAQLRTVSPESLSRLKSDLKLENKSSYRLETLQAFYDRTGSDYVICGSYVSVGDQLRLNINVQDTFRGEITTAVQETGAESDLLTMLSKVGAQLRYRLGLAAQSPGQVNPLLPSNAEAARLYTEGRQKMRVYDAVGANDLLTRSLVIEPAFPLAHYAIADTWTFMGWDAKARDEAKRALDLSAGLSRENQLLIEARYWATVPDWDKAINSLLSLWTLYPDNLDYGLELARAQVSAERGQQALESVDALRKLPHPLSDDPRIDLAQADAELAVSDFAAQRHSAEQALTKAEKLNAPQFEAEALWLQSVALHHLGDNQKAMQACSRGADAAKQFGNQRLQARFLTCLGNIQSDSGNYDEAIRNKQEALRLVTEAGAKRDMSGALANIANMLYAHTGDLDLARKYYEQASQVSAEIGDKQGLALAQINLANLLSTLGSYGESRKTFESAERTYYEIKDPVDAAAAGAGIAQDLFIQGELATAEAKIQEALKTVRTFQSKSDIASDLVLLGDILTAEDRLPEAADAYAESLKLFGELGESGSLATTKLSLAALQLEKGETEKSETLDREAVAEFQNEKDADNEALAESMLAGILFEEHKNDEAVKTITRARGLKIQNRVTALRIDVVAAEIMAGSDGAAAIALLDNTIRKTKDLGLPVLQLEAELMRAQVLRSRGDVNSARSDLAVISKEASDRGFKLIAEKASHQLK